METLVSDDGIFRVQEKSGYHGINFCISFNGVLDMVIYTFTTTLLEYGENLLYDFSNVEKENGLLKCTLPIPRIPLNCSFEIHFNFEKLNGLATLTYNTEKNLDTTVTIPDFPSGEHTELLGEDEKEEVEVKICKCLPFDKFIVICDDQCGNHYEFENGTFTIDDVPICNLDSSGNPDRNIGVQTWVDSKKYSVKGKTWYTRSDPSDQMNPVCKVYTVGTLTIESTKERVDFI